MHSTTATPEPIFAPLTSSMTGERLDIPSLASALALVARALHLTPRQALEALDGQVRAWLFTQCAEGYDTSRYYLVGQHPHTAEVLLTLDQACAVLDALESGTRDEVLAAVRAWFA